MAEKGASAKTEKATPERLKKARAKGQVPQSQEVPSALMIGSLLILLALMSGQLYQWFATRLSGGLSLHVSGSIDNEAFAELLHSSGAACLTVLAPFLFVAAGMSVMGSMAAGGWAFAPKAIKVDMSRISPIKGLKNLFTVKSVVKLLVSLAKLAVILVIAWQYIAGRMDSLLGLQWATPAGTLCAVAGFILGLAGRVVVALMAIACADLLYQRWNYKRELRMSRQEVKEERKQHEVAPEVKGRIRAVQMALARKRMLQDVPTADVVITNPVHFAVALRYDAGTMAAPQVVAKGADFLCRKIKEIAAEHNVPVIEKPELARTLYAAVEVGQVIPETLFITVAEVLAMIYRMRKNKRSGRRDGK